MSWHIKRFSKDQSGAITVDWVVLTAAILGVLFGALTVFNQGAYNHANLTSSTLDAQGIPTY